MISYFAMAAVFGLSAGFAPGPLFTLMLSETLQHGLASGLKVALVPLLTGAPILLACTLVFSQLESMSWILALVGFSGALFVLYLGLMSLRVQPVTVDTTKVKARSLSKGIVTNFLNPYPYIFWMGVGVPLLSRANDEHISHAAAFVAGFFSMVVLAQMSLVTITAASRGFMSGPIYLNSMRFLGVLMCLMAILLMHDTWQMLQQA